MPFSLFRREMNLVTIYALYRGVKLKEQIVFVEKKGKNIRYASELPSTEFHKHCRPCAEILDRYFLPCLEWG